MSGLRFAANVSMLFKESGGIITGFNKAKEAGFKAVECTFPYSETTPAELKAVLEKTGLQHVLINGYPGDFEAGDRGLAAIPDRIQEFKDSLDLSIEYAKALNCKRLHIMSGVHPEKFGVNEMKETLINNLKYASDRLLKENIIGLIEPINTIYSLPNYFLDSFDLAVDVINAVNRENIKLQLDIFHLQLIHGNLKHNIAKYLPLTGHIQVAQPPNRIEPSGPGEIQYQYVFNLLKELDYKGWIGLEYNPSGTTLDSIRWLESWGYK